MLLASYCKLQWEGGTGGGRMYWCLVGFRVRTYKIVVNFKERRVDG